METLLKADIFFFITAIAVIVITVLLSIVLGYLIIILNNTKRISGQIRKQVDLFEEDLGNARDYIQKQGLSLRTLSKVKDFFSGSSRKRGR